MRKEHFLNINFWDTYAFKLYTDCFTTIPSYTSTKVNFLVKFIFLYSAYMATSAFIVLIFWFRVRDPANAVFVANWIMKYVHRMVIKE